LANCRAQQENERDAKSDIGTKRAEIDDGGDDQAKETNAG